MFFLIINYLNRERTNNNLFTILYTTLLLSHWNPRFQNFRILLPLCKTTIINRHSQQQQILPTKRWKFLLMQTNIILQHSVFFRRISILPIIQQLAHIHSPRRIQNMLLDTYNNANYVTQNNIEVMLPLSTGRLVAQFA